MDAKCNISPITILAQLSPGRLPLHALNVILACCCVSSLVVYALKINLNALIVYANGIFYYALSACMLAGCRLLKGALLCTGG
ncbi:transporter [Salmonella enterica subsp. enterica]|uniref:Transporter n=1 Tax=Salmonella enterica I TaxID=59201 RepID=A0A447TPA0_SALET|nr:transporter [Salmonella enterica subsp. enterica]